MGSFSYTCTLSNLTIHAGDAVRYFLLTENPYTDSANACTPKDLWFPRTFPLRAKYNDYGSVERIEEGPARELWLKTFKQDLIEQGWGDNSYHDVPVSRDMTFEALLEALWEGRVFVKRSNGRAELSTDVQAAEDEGRLPVGVPSMKRITKLLQDAKQPLYGGNFGGDAFLVDEQGWGMVRVRHNGSGEDWNKDAKKLSEIVHLFSEYSTMVCAGSGSYAGSGELLIRAKPDTKDFYGGKVYEAPKPLQVRQAMIREDVWQELLKQTVNSYGKDYKTIKIGLKDIQEHARVFWDLCTESIKQYEKQELQLDEGLPGFRTKHPHREWEAYQATAAMDREHFNANVIAEMCKQDEIPYSVGLASQWKAMVAQNHVKKLAKEDVNSWLNSVAEMALIQRKIYGLRYWWRPSYSCGPQYSDHSEHRKFYAMLSKLATKLHKEAARLDE